MEKNRPIRIYNRATGRIETEVVYGGKWMDFFYGRGAGRWITSRLLCRRPLSQLYGLLQRQAFSRGKIDGFVRQYGIDMDEVIVPEGGFKDFNDFFIRRLHLWARPVDGNPERFISPADSRLLVFTIGEDFTLTVKGLRLTLKGLLGTGGPDESYRNGLCLCFRLAPSDYHRFGCVETGVQGRIHSVGGRYHSVNPLALKHKNDILATNRRQWCLLQTRRWGTLLQIEIGAMMVGSIVQHKAAGGPCRRGEEKGYFQFGGSTVLVLVEPGRMKIDTDIIQQSQKGLETLVRYGESIAGAR